MAVISAGFDLVNSVVEYLETFASSPWFYLVIFVIAYFDSIIPAVPSETTVILGGIAAGRGELDIVLVILMGAIGAYLGDTTTYTIGSRSGGLAARFLFRGEKGEENLRRTGEQIRKRGGLLLITARFIPGGRTAITFTCGLTGQPFWRWFTRWDLLAVFVWASYAGLLGFFFGDRFEDDHTAAFWWAFGTALSVTALIEIVRFVRGRLRSPTAPVPDGEFVDDTVDDLVDGAADDAVGEIMGDDIDGRRGVDGDAEPASGARDVGEDRPKERRL